MPNEFIIKNGFHSQGNSEITGSLNVSAGITGSLQGTASFATTASVNTNGNPLIGGSITSGQVAFGTGSGVIGGDSGFTWDNVNKRLGVGTNAPTQAFDVRGKIVAQDTFPSIFVNHSGTILGGIRADGVNKLELKTLTTAPVSIQVNNSEKLRVLDTGNVLINTTTDAGFRLDVNGTARVSGAVESTNTFTALASFVTGIGLSKSTLNSSTNFSNLISIQGWARSLNNTSYRVIGVNGIGGTDAGFGVQSIDRAVGVNGHVAIGNGNKTVATAISLNATAQSTGTGNTITNYYGVFLETSLGAGITNKWGVFQQDSAANNHFNGTILLGTTTNIASSILTVESTTKGFLPPRMTNAQRTAIASPAVGLMVYCTDLVEGLYVYKSTGWTFVI
jgi:hypothetical protein